MYKWVYNVITVKERTAQQGRKEKIKMTYEFSRDREANLKACREWATGHNLPALEGTEKQVAWAEALRYSQFQTWAKVASVFVPEVARPMRDKIVEVVRGETDARFYIDTRNEDDVFDAVKQWERKAKRYEKG